MIASRAKIALVIGLIVSICSSSLEMNLDSNLFKYQEKIRLVVSIFVVFFFKLHELERESS